MWNYNNGCHNNMSFLQWPKTMLAKRQVARKTDNTENLKINPELPTTTWHGSHPTQPPPILPLDYANDNNTNEKRTKTSGRKDGDAVDATALGIRVMKMRKSNSGHADRRRRRRRFPAAVIVAIRRAPHYTRVPSTTTLPSTVSPTCSSSSRSLSL